jgi:dCMP deaminase
VIVKDRVIVSTGYNGAPRGSVNCVDINRCKRRELNVPAGERYELCEAVHAEQNAIINGAPERMKDASIYIAGFEEDGSPAEGKPCLLCARMIRNAQIREVVYFSKAGVITRIDDLQSSGSMSGSG